MDLRRSARSADKLRASFSSVPSSAAAAERGVKEEERVNNKNKLNLKSVPSDSTTVAAKPLTEAERSEKKNYDAQVAKRLWTDQGEIELLKGLDEFAKEGNSITDSSGFYEFIKGSITEDVSLEQVRTKIRHVRDKFRKYETEEKNGGVLSFSKPHLEKCHELSKIIWGAEPGDGGYETARADDSVVLERKNRNTRKSGTAGGGSEEEQEERVQVEDGVERLNEKDGEGDSVTRKRKNKKGKASSAASVLEEEQEESVQVDDVAKKLKATVDKEKDGEGEGESVGVHQKSKNKWIVGSAAILLKKQQERVQVEDVVEKLKEKDGEGDSVTRKRKNNKKGKDSSDVSVLEEEQEESVQVDAAAKKLKATIDKENDGEGEGEGEAVVVHQKSKNKWIVGSAASLLKKQQESVQLNDVAEKMKEKDGEGDSVTRKRKNKKGKDSSDVSVLEEQEDSARENDAAKKLKATIDKEKDGEGDSATRKNKKRKASGAAKKLKATVDKEKYGEGGAFGVHQKSKKRKAIGAAKKLKATVDKEKYGEGEAFGVHQKSKKRKVSSAASVLEEEQEESVQVDGVGKKLKATVEKDGEGEAVWVHQKSKKKLKAGNAVGVHQKSKKKLKAGNAASVLKKQQESVQLNDVAEKMKAMFDRQLEGFGFYEFIQGKEQMIKAPLGLESFLNQKALQTIDPSKMMELEKKWKNVQISEIEMFLERINLVRDYSVILLEALKSPTS